MTYTPPVVARISQHFGDDPQPYQPGGHTGVDYAVPVGTPIKAIGDGIVRHADWASKLGWPNPFYVAIDFDGPANGDQSAGIIVIIDHGPHVSIYAHLSETPLNVGDSVKQGQVIGKSGNTGRSSGPHLHFEMLPDGWDVHNSVYGRINPLPLFTTVKPQSTPTPVAPKAPTKEDKMLVITQAKGDPAIWIGDGVSRRHIPDPKTLADYQKLASWGVLNIYKGGAIQNFPPEAIGADVEKMAAVQAEAIAQRAAALIKGAK